MNKRGTTTMLMLLSLMILENHARAAEPKFVFDQAVEVSEPTPDGLSKPKTTPAGTELQLERGKTYWVSAKGKVPVLIVPENATDAGGKVAARLTLPNVKDWPAATMQTELDEKLASLVDEVARFQEQIRKKDAAEAEQTLRRMENLARLEYLNFLRASLKFVQGDIEGAKDYTRRGLARYPNNEQGKKFLAALEGKK